MKKAEMTAKMALARIRNILFNRITVSAMLFLASTLCMIGYISMLIANPITTGCITGFIALTVLLVIACDRIALLIKKAKVVWTLRKISTDEDFAYYTFLNNKKRYKVATAEDRQAIRSFERRAKAIMK